MSIDVTYRAYELSDVRAVRDLVDEVRAMIDRIGKNELAMSDNLIDRLRSLLAVVPPDLRIALRDEMNGVVGYAQILDAGGLMPSSFGTHILTDFCTRTETLMANESTLAAFS